MNTNELMINDIVIATDCLIDENTDEEQFTDHPAVITDISTNALLPIGGDNSEFGIDWLDDCYSKTIEGIRPMPLTKEIFLMNGFLSDGRTYWKYNCGCYLLTVNPEIGSILVYEGKEHCTSGCATKRIKVDEFCRVHEFQHALRLCGLNELADNLKVE